MHNIYDIIRVAPTAQLRALARELAEILERTNGFALEFIEQSHVPNYLVPVRAKRKLHQDIEALKKLMPLVSTWYAPEQIITIASRSNKTSKEIAELLALTFGEFKGEHQLKNTATMVRHVMHITGLFNTTKPMKYVKEDGTASYTSKRVWRQPKGMKLHPAQLIAHFNKCMEK